MDKQLKKQKMQKLEKRLESRQITLYEVLQEQIAVDWFRSLHPAFLALLDSKGFTQLISYVTQIGPSDNRMRSYKIPMITTEILSSMIPKVFQLFFMEDEEIKGEILLGRLMNYFENPSNHVLSGYVVKILMNLMIGNAVRVLQYIYKNGKIMRVTLYLQSFSMIELLFRIIIVDDTLLNSKIKQRVELFHNIIDIYAENKQSHEILDHINYFLVEGIFRLWTLKHKELGRFSNQIFRVVQLVIDNVSLQVMQNNLFKQQNLMIIIMKHLTNYADEAPFLIVALFKKIHKQMLLTNQNPQIIKTQFKENIPKFSMKNLKLLQALGSMLQNVPQVMIKQLKTNNIFTYLLQFISKFEWNSIVLVEIQIILKHALGPTSSGLVCKVENQSGVTHLTTSTNLKVEQDDKIKDHYYESLYQILFNQTNLSGKIKDMIKKEGDKSKNNHLIGRGYSGFLVNICKYIKLIVKEGTITGALIEKSQREFLEVVQNYLRAKQQLLNSIQCFNVAHDVAKPHYHINTIVDEYKLFFEETQTINKKYQIERLKSMHKEIKQNVLHEIENQNQVVSKLMTESVTQQKKVQAINQIVE